jgi:hypothetical protein
VVSLFIGIFCSSAGLTLQARRSALARAEAEWNANVFARFPELVQTTVEPPRSPVLGGFLLFGSLLWVSEWASLFPSNPGYLQTLILGLIVGIPTMLGVWIGTRLLAQTGRSRIAQDPREPILYLRSFVIDRGDSDRELAKYLGRFGPVLALGRPRERLRSLGAARVYVPDDVWQEVVRRLLVRARLVVLKAAGPTGSVGWELDQCLTLVTPERVLIELPNHKASKRKRLKQYAQFRAGISTPARTLLPEQIRREWRFIAFDSNWRARCLSPRPATNVKEHIQRLLRDDPHVDTEYMLNPICGALGLKDTRSSWRKRWDRLGIQPGL